MRTAVIFNHSPVYLEEKYLFIPVWYHAQEHRRELLRIHSLRYLQTYGYLQEMNWQTFPVARTTWRFSANSGVI